MNEFKNGVVVLKLACLWLGLFCAQKSPVVEKVPTEVKPIVVVGGEKLKINITPTNYNEAQTAKLNEAIEVLAQIMNSENFRQAVISKKKFTNNLGRTNQEIYDHIMTGQELHNPTSIGSMDFSVTMYYSSGKVVGYTYPMASVVHTNSKFYNKYGKCEIAKNLGHEWTHQLGYTHSSASDSDSVPYSVGNIIYELCKTGL